MCDVEDSVQYVTCRTPEGVSFPATIEISDASPEEMRSLMVCRVVLINDAMLNNGALGWVKRCAHIHRYSPRLCITKRPHQHWFWWENIWLQRQFCLFALWSDTGTIALITTEFLPLNHESFRRRHWWGRVLLNCCHGSLKTLGWTYRYRLCMHHNRQTIP